MRPKSTQMHTRGSTKIRPQNLALEVLNGVPVVKTPSINQREALNSSVVLQAKKDTTLGQYL